MTDPNTKKILNTAATKNQSNYLTADNGNTVYTSTNGVWTAYTKNNTATSVSTYDTDTPYKIDKASI